jgi:serine/threonine protein kinase
MVKRIGQTLDGKYRIVNVLAGGMAYVYLLENLESGDRRAAKTLRDEFLGNSAMVARFRRETRIWVAIGSHPNIVRAFSVKEIEGNPFLFMECVDGGSLFDLIKKKASLPVERLLEIAQGIAAALNYVHNCMTPDGIRGIIHRDLTPANVMLTHNDEVKVSDFGLALAVDSTLLTATADMLGTFPYISPEQLKSSHHVDKRTDIYSFGALMYHLACTTPPFAGENWNELTEKIRKHVPAAPAELRKDLPETFSNMLMQCLEKKPEDRLQDFADVRAILFASQMQASGASGSNADAGCTLSRLLDAAEREAAAAGSDLVDPIHLFMSVASNEQETFSRWYRDANVNEDEFTDKLRCYMDKKEHEEIPKKMRFKRSTQRVMALARTFSEQDGAS